jgi:hypothetical protein
MAAETASTDQLFSAIAAGDMAQVTRAGRHWRWPPATSGVSPLVVALHRQRDRRMLLARLPEPTLTIHEAAAVASPASPRS